MASASRARDEVDTSAYLYKEENNEVTEFPEIVIKKEDVKKFEQLLVQSEKITFAFLFYDDKDLCLKKCERVLRNKNALVLADYAEETPPESWSLKALECLFQIQNYTLLKRFGISKYDAQNKFSSSSKILPLRLLWFRICELLSRSESMQVLQSVNSNCEPQFLEVLFLKISDQSEWNKVCDTLYRFKQLSEIIQEFKKVGADCLFKIEPSLSPVNNDIEEVASLINDIYPIHDPDNVGLCIIINEMEFEIAERRIGSEKDVAKLEETMKFFNFEVMTYIDQPSTFFTQQFARTIMKYFKKTHSIFFLAVLSHGRQGGILCSDDKLISIEDHILRPLSVSPPLKNIPKVLIIQACQGEKFLLSKKVVTDGGKSCAKITYDDTKLTLNDLVGSYISDALIAMSSVPGFKSFRDTDKGSVFIQTLCQCLQKYPNDALTDILTAVIKLVNEEVVKSVFKNICFTQQPEFRSLLLQKLYLKKKHT